MLIRFSTHLGRCRRPHRSLNGRGYQRERGARTSAHLASICKDFAMGSAREKSRKALETSPKYDEVEGAPSSAALRAAPSGLSSTLSYLRFVSDYFPDFSRPLQNAKFLQVDINRPEVRAPRPR